MSDLINRQAAIDALCNVGCGSGYCGISCDDVKAIEQLPSVEVEPVKHGRWEEKAVSNCRIDEWQSARCSACGRYHTTPYLYYFTDDQYCPCCGAKMDLEGEPHEQN